MKILILSIYLFTGLLRTYFIGVAESEIHHSGVLECFCLGECLLGYDVKSFILLLETIPAFLIIGHFYSFSLMKRSLISVLFAFCLDILSRLLSELISMLSEFSHGFFLWDLHWEFNDLIISIDSMIWRLLSTYLLLAVFYLFVRRKNHQTLTD